MDVVIPGVRRGLLVACSCDLRDFMNDIGDIGKDISYHDYLERISDFCHFCLQVATPPPRNQLFHMYYTNMHNLFAPYHKSYHVTEVRPPEVA